MSITATNNPYPESTDPTPSKLDKGGYDGNAETLDTKIDAVLEEAKLLIGNQLADVTYMGTAEPGDTPTGTGNRYWTAITPATYPNHGNKVVTANSFAIISVSAAGNWSVSQTAFNFSGKVNVSDVVNNLTSTETTKPLSAAQGKILNEKNVKIENWTAIAFASGDQVNYLGKDWVSNAATLSTDIPGTSVKWVERLTGYILKEDAVTSIIGKNKFNKSTAKLGFYLEPSGAFSPSASLDVSDFIPVSSGLNYIANNNIRFSCYYDANKNVVSGGSSVNITSFTVPVGVAFVKITIFHTAINVFQLESGTVVTTYKSYRKVLNPEQINYNDFLIDNVKESELIKGVSSAGIFATLKNKADLIVSKNIFDKTTVLTGYYLSNGLLTVSPTYDVSDFIPVIIGQVYKSSSSTRFTSYYDANKNFVSGGSNIDITTFTVPTGVAFVRVTVYDIYLNTYQLELGTIVTAYEPYKKILNSQQIRLSDILVSIIEETETQKGVVSSALFLALKNKLETSRIVDIKSVYYVLDNNNNVLFYIDKKGVVKGNFGLKTSDDYISQQTAINTLTTSVNKAVSNKIYCWGDSLTDGTNGLGFTFPLRLQSNLGSNYSVVNCGVGGDTSVEIMARQGSAPAYFGVDWVLPAGTTPVAIGEGSSIPLLSTFDNSILIQFNPLWTGGHTLTTVWVDGIECTLRYVTGSAPHTIERKIAGSARNIYAGSMIVPNGANYRNSLLNVFWLGANGGWDTANPITLINQIKASIEFANSNNYVVIGNHKNFTHTAAIEALQLKEFGLRFINLRKYCYQNALGDLGITPTSQDIIDISNETCPTSLLSDSVHFKSVGYSMIGDLVHKRITLLNMI